LGSTNTKDKRGGGGGGGRRGPHNATNKRPFLKSAAAHTAALVFCRQHTKRKSQAFFKPHPSRKNCAVLERHSLHEQQQSKRNNNPQLKAALN